MIMSDVEGERRGPVRVWINGLGGDHARWEAQRVTVMKSEKMPV
jgi:hypothetical protein